MLPKYLHILIVHQVLWCVTMKLVIRVMDQGLKVKQKNFLDNPLFLASCWHFPFLFAQVVILQECLDAWLFFWIPIYPWKVKCLALHTMHVNWLRGTLFGLHVVPDLQNKIPRNDLWNNVHSWVHDWNLKSRIYKVNSSYVRKQAVELGTTVIC